MTELLNTFSKSKNVHIQSFAPCCFPSPQLKELNVSAEVGQCVQRVTQQPLCAGAPAFLNREQGHKQNTDHVYLRINKSDELMAYFAVAYDPDIHTQRLCIAPGIW